MSAANWGIGGGGAKYFFSGPKCPPSYKIGPGALAAQGFLANWLLTLLREGKRTQT